MCVCVPICHRHKVLMINRVCVCVQADPVFGTQHDRRPLFEQVIFLYRYLSLTLVQRACADIWQQCDS